MRRWLRAAAILALAYVSAPAALGQAEPSPDQLRKMYNDTLHQLQDAQDRKNQLAGENDKLNAKVADLQKQLDAARAQLDQQQRQSADFAGRTFDLRAQFATWQQFVAGDPALQRRWQRFLQMSTEASLPRTAADEIGANWPWSSGE